MKRLERLLFISMVLIFIYCFSSATKVLYGKAASADSDLIQLSVSVGTLSPEFDSGTTEYSLYLDGCENITVIPFASSFYASIDIDGVKCRSGAECTIPVSALPQEIDITVTAQNGMRKEYTINAVLNTKAVPHLTGLSVGTESLCPAFDSNTTDYSMNVDCGVKSVAVTPYADSSVTTLMVDNQTVDSGSSCEIPVFEGSNIITVTVTTKECASKTYIISVTRAAMPSPALSALKLSAGSLSPSFSSSKTSYTAKVDSSVDSLTITPTGNISADKISIGSAIVKSGDGYEISLNNGVNTICITAASDNGESTSYTLEITKAEKGEATLSGIAVSDGTLNPEFSPSAYDYSLKTGSDNYEMGITPKDTDGSDTIAVNGTIVQSGGTYNVPLLVGDNTVKIEVVSSNGVKNTYSVTITRAAADSPGLLSLSLSSGTLNPEFSNRVINYSTTVNYAISRITITPMARDNTQTVTVNGSTVAYGSDYSLDLAAGVNTIRICVSMPDGSSQKDYTLTVTRCVEKAAGLSRLTIDAGTLNPVFSTDVTDYSAEVENSVTSVTIDAIADDDSAKVKISGTETNTEHLSVGSNTVTVTVTSVDGSQKVYTINIFRRYKTNITVSSKNADGSYTAAVPDYLSLIGDSDCFDFKLGDNSVVLSAGTLKKYKSGGGLYVTEKTCGSEVLAKALACAADNCIVASGREIAITGGTALTGNEINAGAVLKLSSAEEKILQDGTPVVYYFDEINSKLENAGASFNLNDGTVSFTAGKDGIYVFASNLKSPCIDYNVSADSLYKRNGAVKTFNVNVTRGGVSTRLENASVMIVTTLSTGEQNYCFIPVSGDSASFLVDVDGRAVHSDIYLISGSFSGQSIPKTYSLTQNVNT